MTIAKDHAVDARKHVRDYFESPNTADVDENLLREATAEALVSIAYSLATIAEQMPRRGPVEIEL